MDIESCEHNFVYKGVEYQMRGYCCSRTHQEVRAYWESYYCTKCLKKEKKLMNETDTSECNVKFDATPITDR